LYDGSFHKTASCEKEIEEREEEERKGDGGMKSEREIIKIVKC